MSTNKTIKALREEQAQLYAEIRRLQTLAGVQPTIREMARDAREGIKAAPSAPVERDERAAFERAVLAEWPQAPVSRKRDLLPKDDPCYGDYCDEPLQRCWVGWRMRAWLEGAKPSVLSKCALCDQLQADLTARDEQNDQLRMDAGRYRWLRSRDLDAISQGGVFAGLTPDNLVLNEETLDQAVDAAMYTTPPCGGANICQADQEVMHISDLGSDATCGVCYDTGHIIIDDTGPDYVTAPCTECELAKQAGHGR